LGLWMLFLCVMGAVSTVGEIHGELTALVCMCSAISLAVV